MAPPAPVLPVSVVAVMTPNVTSSTIEPAAVNVTVPLLAVSGLKTLIPPAVVVRLRPPLPASTVPLVFSVWPLVNANPLLAVKALRLLIAFAWFSATLEFEKPVRTRPIRPPATSR